MAYKVFQNGFPLPASDLNNFLMNQSVIVFSNASARSSTLPTPTEGMVTYLEDTNALEVYTGSAWVNVNDNTNAILKSTVTTAGDLIVGTGNATVSRLGVGANGTLLLSNGTTPTWLALGTTGQVLTSNGTTAIWTTAPAGSQTTIQTTNLSGNSTITFSSIPNTYRELRLYVKNFDVGTTKTDVRLTVNGSTANYFQGTSAGATTGSISIFSQESADGNNSGYVDFRNYTESDTHKFMLISSYSTDGVTNLNTRTSAGVWRDNAVINSITLTRSGTVGTWTSGTATLIGIN